MQSSPSSNIPALKSDLRIVYMGSSLFAIPTLQRLYEEGYGIPGVITQPDKPKGRGNALAGPPVKAKAIELHLPVYQPATLKDDEARSLLKLLAPHVIVVVAYGKILPPWLLELPAYGCINLHASLLPKYRGAAPIHWAIAEGETRTGVCTMQMDEGLDTGPVLLCEETSIGPDETVNELSARLAVIGSELTARTVEGVVNSTIKPVPQDNSKAGVAPILKKSHGLIDWRKPSPSIHNQVRAFNPWPGTVTRFRGGGCKILKTRLGTDCSLEPGALVVAKNSLSVCCGDRRTLEVLELQMENRKPVGGAQFIHGARVQAGENFDVVIDNGRQ